MHFSFSNSLISAFTFFPSPIFLRGCFLFFFPSPKISGWILKSLFSLSLLIIKYIRLRRTVPAVSHRCAYVALRFPMLSTYLLLCSLFLPWPNSNLGKHFKFFQAVRFFSLYKFTLFCRGLTAWWSKDSPLAQLLFWVDCELLHSVTGGWQEIFAEHMSLGKPKCLKSFCLP